MRREPRAPSTIDVQLLDTTAMEASALTYLRAHAETDIKLGKEGVKMPSKVRVGWTWGVVDTAEGLYALCDEGVGPADPITADNKLALDIYVDGYEGDKPGDGEPGMPTFISMFPACTIKLTDVELSEAATGEYVPLHEFIREFGSRLEDNYRGWVRTLEKAS